MHNGTKSIRKLNLAHFADSWALNENYSSQMDHKDQTHDMSKLIQTELAKCMENLFQHDNGSWQWIRDETSLPDHVQDVHDQGERYHPFDGHYAFTTMPSMESKEWTIDYSASSHICCNPKLLNTTYKIGKFSMIFRSDGSSRDVVFAGKARIGKDTLLVDVLYYYVPSFTHNLLAMAQLIQTVGLECIFYPTHCKFQKEQTYELVGVGMMRGNRYFIDTIYEHYYVNFFNSKNLSAKYWHMIIRHPSITTMRHLDVGDQRFASEVLKVLKF